MKSKQTPSVNKSLNKCMPSEYVVPINSNIHLKTKISEVLNFSFSKTMNASILTTSEFEKGSKIYPILFILDDDDFIPVALLGLEDKQNLFLKWNNQWDGGYIPAYIRRYPFSLAPVNEASEFVVCLDEKSTVIGNSGEFSLFLANGQQSEFLTEKIRFLQELQIGYEKTLQFTKKIHELDLFEAMNANINLSNGDSLSVSGFYVISQDKFKSLDNDIYKELINDNKMKLIYEHFSSLDNFSKLIDVIAERKVISKGNHSSREKTKINNTKADILKHKKTKVSA